MTLSTFPDVNVWLALLLENHVHRAAARRWLVIVYRVRPDRLSAGNPDERPAPAHYIGGDERQAIADDGGLGSLRQLIRQYARKNHASPKLWADAWLLAFAECADGVVVTFDQALAARAKHTVLLS